MVGLEKMIKAALQFLEKRILIVGKSIDDSGVNIVKGLSKVEAAINAIEKNEKPEFDVKPIVAELKVIAAKIPKVEKPEKQEADTTAHDLLREILVAVNNNSPKDFPIDALDEVFSGLKPKESVRFDDKQMKGLMAALTSNRGFGGGGENKSATTWEVDRVVLTDANTEYSYQFPANTTTWTLKLRGSATFYYSSATGKLPVSGDNTTYMTVPANGTRSQDNVEWGGKTIYFESATAGSVVELEVFTM